MLQTIDLQTPRYVTMPLILDVIQQQLCALTKGIGSTKRVDATPCVGAGAGDG
jgi:hypothetical protein